MRSIFISYRRDDTEGQAGRLFQDLREAFGADRVFMDVATIEPGVDFRRAIERQTQSCGVLLALIGRNWLLVADEQGHRRLDDPGDFVRLETASALQRDIPVIPVLVHGARMPRADELPDDLKDLAYRNSVELTHARWDSDLQLLIKALRTYITDQPSAPAAPQPAPVAAARRWLVPLAAALAVAVAGVAWYAFDSRQQAQRMHEQQAAMERQLLVERAAAAQAASEHAAKQAAQDKAAADRSAAEKGAEKRRPREQPPTGLRPSASPPTRRARRASVPPRRRPTPNGPLPRHSALRRSRPPTRPRPTSWPPNRRPRSVLQSKERPTNVPPASVPLRTVPPRTAQRQSVPAPNAPQRSSAWRRHARCNAASTMRAYAPAVSSGARRCPATRCA